jgi:hypothetical protein
MQRLRHKGAVHAPGFTPLVGQYNRPAPLYVCYTRGHVEFHHLSDVDNTGLQYYCVKADTVELAAKLIYYGGKAVKILRGSLPPEIPPIEP